MSDVSAALFQQMRLTILLTAKDGIEESPFHVAYLQAWQDGVCPFLDIHADWHTPHEDQFPISSGKAFTLFKILAHRREGQKGISFRELEKELGIQDDQHSSGDFTRYEVVKICRYFFLKECFENSFWSVLCEDGECPVSAHSVLKSDFKVYFT